MFGRADESVVNSNTIGDAICPASGCASVADADDGPDPESRAVAMKYALAGFGRAVGGNVIEMVGQRGAMRDIELVESYVAVGGWRLDLDTLGFGEGDGGGLSGWVTSALDFVGIDLDSDQGLFFAFAPTWGTPSTGAEGMWSSTRAAQALLATGGAELGMNLDTRVGYGMNLSNGKGLLTRFSEMGKPNGGPAHLRVGTQLGRLQTKGSQLTLELYGERISPILDEEPAYGIVLNAGGRF